MTANIRRRPPTSLRSCARSRRPIRTRWWSAPIRSNSVGMVRAVNEIGFKPKMIGGAMVGLQTTVFKTQLGPLLNGWINYETWVPSKQALTPEVEAFLKEYQSRAKAAGVDPLGYYLGTWGYAYVELLGKAVDGHQVAERRQDRRISAHEHDPDHHGSDQVRQERRMGRVGHDAGPVQGHQRQRPRAVPRHGYADGRDAAEACDRRSRRCRSRKLR